MISFVILLMVILGFSIAGLFIHAISCLWGNGDYDDDDDCDDDTNDPFCPQCTQVV